MTQEALKLALEALMRSRKAVSGNLDLAGCAYGKNDLDGHRYSDAKKALVTLDKALAAIKEALAQPEQEPVAWRKREVGGGWQYYGWEETGMTYEAVNRSNKNGFECEAIPATPPQRKPPTVDVRILQAVSDEYNAWIRAHASGMGYDDFLIQRLAAHDIKENT